MVGCWSLAPCVLELAAPRYIRYCFGTCCRKFELGLDGLVMAPLMLLDAPAIAMADVLDQPVCLERVEEGIRVCQKPIVPMCCWPDCLIISQWCAQFLLDSLAPTSFLCFYEPVYWLVEGMFIFLLELTIIEVFLFGDSELWLTYPSFGIGCSFLSAGNQMLLQFCMPVFELLPCRLGPPIVAIPVQSALLEFIIFCPQFDN